MLPNPVLSQTLRWTSCPVRKDGGADKTVVGDEIRLGACGRERGRRPQEGSVELKLTDRRLVRWVTAQHLFGVGSGKRGDGRALVRGSPAGRIVLAAIGPEGGDWRERSIKVLKRPAVERWGRERGKDWGRASFGSRGCRERGRPRLLLRCRGLVESVLCNCSRRRR